MKHSSSGSMSETYEVKAMMPYNGNWNNILRNLYVDLFNLIVESRIPGMNERGYGNGCHCPPLLGQNVHLCDLLKPECRKHQTMIHHLLRAVRHNVFEIEVMMLPECCSDLKLSERIQKKEYILLERWSMKFFESDKSQYSIEIPELLRAVRSFLHFSQISAWLSSTKGKSPANIYYWVKPTPDPSSTQFENNPEIHSFPLFKVNEELYGTVRVDYPTRKQYIPIIPCSKHPPIPGLRLRLTENSNLSPAIPFNQQIVKQLQKNCDNQQPIIAEKHCATDPKLLKTSSTTVLKTVTHNIGGINKTNRILKHSNSGIAVKSINGGLSNSCGAQLINKEISSNSETVPFNNYGQTYLKCSSQENLCCGNSMPLLHSNESKLNNLSKELHPSYCEADFVPVEIAHHYTSKHNAPKCSSISSNFTNSDVCHISSSVSNLLLPMVEPSQSSSSNMPLDSNSVLGIERNIFRKSLKRKYVTGNEVNDIPDKRMCVYKEKCEENRSFQKGSSFCQNDNLKKPFKRKQCQFTLSSKKASNLINCVQVENCIKNKLFNEEINDQNSSNSTSFKIACISSNRKVMEEKSKQASKSSSDQTWNECSDIMLGSECNLSVNSGLVKMKLVNTPQQTDCTNQIDDSSNSGKVLPSSFYSSCNVLPQKATPYLDCFPRHKLKFARGRKLLGNFEESILKGYLTPCSSVKGFHTEIGASGSFCPNHITLPADVSFYDMDNLNSATFPYMAHVSLGEIEYYVPKKGAVQVTLFNPSETVVKMFVINYDLSDMPPSSHTFIRQKTYYVPVGSTEDCPSSPKWLRYILHLRFASSKSGKLYLYKDFKIVVLNKSNDDAASEFSQEPRELRSFLHVPRNPTFSNF